MATGSTHTPSPPDSHSGSGSFTPASSAIGPSLPGGSAQVGIDYDIVQNSTQKVNAVTGTLVATHQGDGQTRSASFSLASTDTVPLDLNLPGLWDVQLASLSLDNVFSATFSLAAVPFIQYTLGFGCGDPGTNSDNDITCVADGRLDHTMASFPFYSTTPFGLALAESNILDPFQIDVLPSQVASVPGPPTLSLLAFGFFGTGVLPKRRRKS